MSNVSQMSSADERKERRRLHLREIAQETESVGESDSTDASAAPAEEHEAVGAILRAARVARGEEAAKVAAILKMRREQLVAIEENDLDRLPGRAYTVGFVRAYASYLGLDAEALVQQFKDENATEPFAKPVEHVFPEASTETANFVPSGSILIWALLIAMIIYAITYLTLPERKTSVGTTAKANESGVIVEQPKAVTKPTSAAPKSDEASPTAAASKSGDVSDASATTFVGGDKMVPGDAADDAAIQSPYLRDAPPAVPSFKIAEVKAAPKAAAPAKPEPARIVFKALQPTYIQIKDPKQGATLISRVLEPGETYLPPVRTGLIMQTGNAGGLQVEVDGRVIGVMGKSGEVIARMPLDASYFLERFATQQ